jgi:hypothetical protein
LGYGYSEAHQSHARETNKWQKSAWSRHFRPEEEIKFQFVIARTDGFTPAAVPKVQIIKVSDKA